VHHFPRQNKRLSVEVAQGIILISLALPLLVQDMAQVKSKAEGKHCPAAAQTVSNCW
jgi:hypothetical protein